LIDLENCLFITVHVRLQHACYYWLQEYVKKRRKIVATDLLLN